LTTRFVNTRVDRPRWRINAAATVTPRLTLGVEYNPVVREFVPTANWIAVTESAKMPTVSFGTSSDRIFSPDGTQSYFVTVAKGFGKIGPYVGLSYSSWENRVLMPWGVNYSLDPKWDLMFMQDGVNSHGLLTYKAQTFSVSAMLVKMKYPGISLSLRF
jgi:hypothetical protein